MGPRRIISLLPSATEIVCALGLEDRLVGVTHECDFPVSVRALPKVTRTLIPSDATSRQIDGLVRDRLESGRALYSLDEGVLDRLRPDLIVTQTLCNVCAVAEDEVRAAVDRLPGTVEVVNLEPTTLREVLESIGQVAAAAHCEGAGEALIESLERRIANVQVIAASRSDRPRVLLLEWLDPPFVSGHWNPELVELAGGVELLGASGRPSRVATWKEIDAANPDVIVIACCGFDIERTLVELPSVTELPECRELACVRSGRVFVTDGSAYFSRPGPRLIDGLERLCQALALPAEEGLRENRFRFL